MPKLTDDFRIHYAGAAPGGDTAPATERPDHGQRAIKRQVRFDYVIYGPQVSNTATEAQEPEIEIVDPDWAETGLRVHQQDFKRLAARLVEVALDHAAENAAGPELRLVRTLRLMCGPNPLIEGDVTVSRRPAVTGGRYREGRDANPPRIVSDLPQRSLYL